MAITRIGNPAIADQRGVNFRNIIINGDMSIAQRGTSQASAGSTNGSYDTVDRFAFAEQLGTFTMSQETDVPTGQGFAKSLKLDCTTADASPASNAYLQFIQRVEGQNLQYLKKGTSSAESLTMSFWVKSSKTGTFILELDDNDNARNIDKSYTINSANTWEKKIITFDGDTTGSFDNDNGDSLRLIWWLAAGSNFTSGTLQTSWGSTVNTDRAVGQVNLADSTSNEWYITGVQLEAGQVASDFEFLPQDVNLQRCQRYYFVKCDGSVSVSQDIGVAFYYTSSDLRGSFSFPTTMRTIPTLEMESVTDGYDFRRNSGVDRMNEFALNNASLSSAGIVANSLVSGIAGQAGHLFTDDASCFVAVSAEL